MSRNFKIFLLASCFFSIVAWADVIQGDIVADLSSEEIKAELNMRDSIMAIRENACKAESDSLRGVVAVEQAKSANWEQSFNTVMKDNSICQQALRVSIDANTEKKNNKDFQKDAAMMSGSAFLGGIGLGMLLFWLIFE